MKQAIVPLLLGMVLILSAYQTKTLSFSEIEVVPEEIEQMMEDDLRLQMIQDGQEGSYIIFHAQGDIEADLDTAGETLTVIFNEVDSNATERKRFVYYLTTDKNRDTIKVKVNGKEVAFDDITI